MRGRGIWSAAVVMAGLAWVLPAEAAPSGGALNQVYELHVTVAGEAGVPLDAKAVALNVTAASPQANGFMTVYPCGGAEPGVSNLNFAAGVGAVANAVLAGIGTDGEVCITTSSTSDVLVDVLGYVPAGSSLTPLTTPTRVFDSRASGMISPGPAGRVAVQVGGLGGIPVDAAAAIVNLTVVGASAGGYASAYPCDQPWPGTSNLNFAANEARPNLVSTRLDAQGRVCVLVSESANVIVDASGYVPAEASGFTTLDAPQRLLDTRIGLGAPAAQVGPSNPVVLQVTGRAGVPGSAQTAVLNITSTLGAAPGYVTVYPCGTPPNTSNLNFVPGADIANISMSALDGLGRTCLFSSAPTHLIADITGWFSSAAAYTPLTAPVRIYDSRMLSDPVCNQVVFPPTGSSTVSIVARSLADGRERTVTYPSAQSRTLSAVMSAGCDAIITLQQQYGAGAYTIWRRPFVGSPTLLGTLGAGTPIVPFAPIDLLDDGRIILGGAYDYTSPTGRIINSNYMNRPVGVTPDGALSVWVSSSLGNYSMYLIDVAQDRTVYTVDLGPYGYDPRMSKEGTFISYGASWDNQGGVYREYPVIAGLDGEVLDVFPDGPVPGPVRTSWLTDDEVIVCVPNRVPVIWTVYGSTRSIGGTRTTCPTGS